MKLTLIILTATALAVGFSAWLGCKAKSKLQIERQALWQPKIGDRVQSTYRPGNFGGEPFITTITQLVFVGKQRSQTGLLVYGDGLPGVDSWWVTPAP
jgi:hypothetical protein